MHAKTSRLVAMIAATPLANPSRPSSRLMAFVTPTIHTVVTNPPKSPSDTLPQNGRYRWESERRCFGRENGRQKTCQENQIHAESKRCLALCFNEPGFNKT